MSEKEKEFEKEFKNNLSDEEMVYLYHITGKGIGELICNNGLLLVEDRLSSTTIPIDNEIMSNPIKFISEEHVGNIRETEEMIIVGCPKDEIDNLVVKNENQYADWNEDVESNYIISPNYVMGYIDMNNLDFIYNEGYGYYNNKAL